jgi:LysM repeat protein
MRSVSLAAIAFVTLVNTSCELFKPKDQPAAYDPYGQQTNPYGQAPASNPYGQAAANPYGAVPPASNPYGSYEQPQTSTTPPSPYSSTPAYSGSSSTPASGGGGSVTVKSGDTLTSIAKRNGTSVSALRSANGLTGDLIRVGQKLNLP